MVAFSCNACGDTVKKNQVEKHLFRCRACTVLSCLDCGKDFHGEEYQNHVKCISEEEKYSGKGFKPKANADKGEKRQEEWIAVFRESIATANVRPPLKHLLERLATFNNIPRKQQKFENFTRQCASVKNDMLIKEAWNIVSKAFEDSKKQPNEQTKNEKPEEGCSPKPEKMAEEEKAAKKLSKRERKEARQKRSKMEKKDMREVLPAPVVKGQPPEDKEPSRKRKRKHKENEEETGAFTNGSDAEEVHQSENDIQSSKKRKKNKYENIEIQEEPEGEEPVQKRVRTGAADSKVSMAEKFKWAEIIKTLLEAADENQLSLKRLKKKVVAEYSSRGYSKPTTKEQLEAKLLKKVQKNPVFKMHKDRVKLVL